MEESKVLEVPCPFYASFVHHLSPPCFPLPYRKPAVREMLNMPQAMIKSRTSLKWLPPGSSALEGWIPMMTPILAEVR
jgi:hypothetical protein